MRAGLVGQVGPLTKTVTLTDVIVRGPHLLPGAGAPLTETDLGSRGGYLCSVTKLRPEQSLPSNFSHIHHSGQPPHISSTKRNITGLGRDPHLHSGAAIPEWKT